MEALIVFAAIEATAIVLLVSYLVGVREDRDMWKELRNSSCKEVSRLIPYKQLADQQAERLRKIKELCP